MEEKFIRKINTITFVCINGAENSFKKYFRVHVRLQRKFLLLHLVDFEKRNLDKARNRIITLGYLRLTNVDKLNNETVAVPPLIHRVCTIAVRRIQI